MQVLLFSAEWCAPCKQFKKVASDLISGISGLELIIVDVDANKELAAEYGVKAVPMLVAGDKVLKGAVTHSKLQEFIYEAMGWSG